MSQVRTHGVEALLSGIGIAGIPIALYVPSEAWPGTLVPVITLLGFLTLGSIAGWRGSWLSLIAILAAAVAAGWWMGADQARLALADGNRVGADLAVPVYVLMGIGFVLVVGVPGYALGWLARRIVLRRTAEDPPAAPPVGPS